MTLILGDSLEVLKTLPDNSVDACVTDPPYGLGKEPNIRNVLTQWLEYGHAEISGKGFMGKEWDAFVPQPALWREVFRVLKPGAHVLSFFGTRTYDLGVTAIRLAGFEVRDSVYWHYGSGFPKSLDVSKAIDKAAGAEREVLREGFTSSDEQGDVYAKGLNANFQPRQITAPATEDAKRWQGFGTALKPATEPIVLARKPLEKGLTVAENVLKWGTGAINVDGCRIALNGEKISNSKSQPYASATTWNVSKTPGIERPQPHGRWPANVIFDEAAAGMLDEQSAGTRASKPSVSGRSTKNASASLTGMGGTDRNPSYSDSGGASRFFYVAKASKRERNAGLDGMPKKKSNYRPGDDEGRNTIRERLHNSVGKVNHHPTVKPIKLMEYLIKLITPPNGVVLDPFMGSGSTGVAAKKLGFQFIGIELNPEYLEIAKKRIEAGKR